MTSLRTQFFNIPLSKPLALKLSRGQVAQRQRRNLHFAVASALLAEAELLPEISQPVIPERFSNAGARPILTR